MKEDRTNSESRNKVVTYLIFLEELMWATEVLGLGSARSHISEVATSTTFIAIANGVTFGDDVAKNLSRKFPSNTTLFEVLF